MFERQSFRTTAAHRPAFRPGAVPGGYGQIALIIQENVELRSGLPSGGHFRAHDPQVPGGRLLRADRIAAPAPAAACSWPRCMSTTEIRYTGRTLAGLSAGTGPEPRARGAPLGHGAVSRDGGSLPASAQVARGHRVQGGAEGLVHGGARSRFVPSQDGRQWGPPWPGSGLPEEKTVMFQEYSGNRGDRRPGLLWGRSAVVVPRESSALWVGNLDPDGWGPPGRRL